jgi:hypothetical protein
VLGNGSWAIGRGINPGDGMWCSVDAHEEARTIGPTVAADPQGSA